jgi:hypothetical protein
MGTRRCRSSGQPPASCQRASTRSWRAAMTSRSSRASARIRPLPLTQHVAMALALSDFFTLSKTVFPEGKLANSRGNHSQAAEIFG